MSNGTHLVLEDGSIYQGEAFGADAHSHGEVVFNTSMTGYQEVLTDPSYAGQIVVLTYPLAGNYGINPQDYESRRIQVAGLVVREHCLYPSHGLSTTTLHEFLASQGIPGVAGVDTRSITRRLRNQGVMMGAIRQVEKTVHPVGQVADLRQPAGEPRLATWSEPASYSKYVDGSTTEVALAELQDMPRYGDVDFVQRVTTGEAYTWDTPSDIPATGRRILVADLGLKYNILRLLRARGCEVMAVPAATSASEMLDLKPSGLVLSPGPGDPALLEDVVDNVRRLVGRVPILGICLGHQIVARALGARTFKLKFGHRGANHPVKSLATGRVYITAQNHGYAVDGDSLPPGLEISHVNLNDGTVEGLSYNGASILTIQYHSEASPGPRDNEYLFDRFLEMVNDQPA